jgi:putative copper resistance protein D
MLDALAAGAKVLLYAALLCCAGSVFAVATLPRSALLERYAARLTQHGAIATLVVATVSALLLYLQLGGSGDEPALLAVFASGRGAALCLQVAGAVLLLVMPRDADPRSGIRLSNAALLPAALAISGHAATAGLLNAVVVLVHASAAAWWIGSLLLLRHSWARDEPAAFAAAVAAFSGWARSVVLALVVAGIVLVATLVEFSIDALFTPYVGLLLLKILLAALVLAIANDNRRRLATRILAGDAGAAAALCRRIDVELVVIALVLIVTAVLTSYTTPQ